MVYPVSNALAQQIPAANTFQPGGTEATKRPEENRTLDSTRPSGTDTARSERAATRNDDRSYQAAESRSRDSGAITASSSRGTQLDITA